VVEIERLADLPAGTLGHVLAGRRTALGGVAAARRIAPVLRVRVAWLVLGEGPAYWFVKELCASGNPLVDLKDARSAAKRCGGRVVAYTPRLPVGGQSRAPRGG
jgi:hypothetical protein